MTTKELIKVLQTYPEDTTIYMSSDEEGNSYHTINTISTVEVEKSNGQGTFDALCIYPTSEDIELSAY